MFRYNNIYKRLFLIRFTRHPHDKAPNRSNNKDIIISHADINCASIVLPIYVHNFDTDRSIRG